METKEVPGSKNPDWRPLTNWQVLGASLFLLFWVSLFAGGITVDTTQFRCAISPTGAEVLASEARPARPGDAAATAVCKDYASAGNTWQKKALAWVGILLFFLPLNLAMVSAVAGGLGALGNKANLEHDELISDEPMQRTIKSRDHSNPIMSGLLRGLFVYLFFISGLLLFDDKPFSSPGPGQYIRLAGFISLFSFLVNYRPHLFTTILDWALARIDRGKSADTQQTAQVKVAQTKEVTVTVPATTVAVNGDGEEKAPIPVSTPVSKD